MIAKVRTTRHGSAVSSSRTPPGAAQGERWRVSVIIDDDLEKCLDTIDLFNEYHSHEENGRAMVDMLARHWRVLIGLMKDLKLHDARSRTAAPSGRRFPSAPFARP